MAGQSSLGPYLRQTGAEEIEHMTLLDEEDLYSLNLKNIQMKKLHRAIAKIES